MVIKQIKGIVEPGRSIGRTLDFPTANVRFDGVLGIKNGIYFARATVCGGIYFSLVNVGVRPTFSADGSITVEAYLIDFEGDIYGAEISIEFLQYIRSEQRFDSVEHLRLQMVSDLDLAKRLIKLNNYE